MSRRRPTEVRQAKDKGQQTARAGFRSAPKAKRKECPQTGKKCIYDCEGDDCWSEMNGA